MRCLRSNTSRSLTTMPLPSGVQVTRSLLGSSTREYNLLLVFWIVSWISCRFDGPDGIEKKIRRAFVSDGRVEVSSATLALVVACGCCVANELGHRFETRRRRNMRVVVGTARVLVVETRAATVASIGEFEGHAGHANRWNLQDERRGGNAVELERVERGFT